MSETGTLQQDVASTGEALALTGINKHFPGVHALKNVSMELRGGEIHVLMGLNGAGKSTLINILSGVYPADSGDIYIGKQKVGFIAPHEASAAGLATIHQEFNLIDWFTVWENIALGHETGSAIPFKLDRKADRQKAQKVLGGMGVDIDVDKRVKDLSIGEKQFVEVAKALSLKSSILLLDEPTTPLNQQEVKELFSLLNRLKDDGKAIVFISHHLEEIMEIGDRVTILRDGECIGTWDVAQMGEKEIVKAMAGKELIRRERRLRSVSQDGAPVLQLRNISWAHKLKEISFSLFPGEILGVAGLLGSGRTELMNVIAGVERPDAGDIILRGEKVEFSSPSQSLRKGISMVTEDRKASGLLASMSMGHNISLSGLARKMGVGPVGWVNRGTENEGIQSIISRFRIQPPVADRLIKNFSGGNQQKVLLGRAIYVETDLFLLDEPTRGVDVHAKAEIFEDIVRLADEGKSFLVVSSDFNELLTYCDRILVLYQGSLVKELRDDDMDNTILLNHVLGNRE